MNDLDCSKDKNGIWIEVGKSLMPCVIFDSETKDIIAINDSFSTLFGVNTIEDKKIDQLNLPKEFFKNDVIETTQFSNNILVTHTFKISSVNLNDNLVCYFAQDWTEFQNLRMQYYSSSSKYKSFFSAIELAFCVIDKRGNILEINTFFENLFKTEERNINNIYTIFSESSFQSNIRHLTENVSSNSPIVFELRATVNNYTQWFEITANSYINGSENNETKVLVAAKNITEKKNSQQKQYIEDQKKNDAFRQELNSLRINESDLKK